MAKIGRARESYPTHGNIYISLVSNNPHSNLDISPEASQKFAYITTKLHKFAKTHEL